MFDPLLLDPLFVAASDMVLHSFLLVAGGLLAAVSLRTFAAESRADLWTILFLALVALPFVSSLLPTGWLWSTMVVPTEPTAVVAAGPSEADGTGSASTGDVGPGFSGVSGESGPARALGGSVGAPPTSVSGAAPVAEARPDAAPAVPRAFLAEVLVLFWSMGALFLALRLARSLATARALLGRSTALRSETWGRDLRTAGAQLAKDPVVVDLRTSPEIDVPVTFGHRRPVILLPPSASEWSAERRRCVLVHELAHVVRRDWSRAVLADLVCGLYWMQPLVWIARRRLVEECERAADDAVVGSGVRASTYAGHLLALAESLCPVPSMPAGPVMPAVRPSSLEVRVRALLRPGLSARLPRWTVCGLVVVLLGTSLGLSTISEAAPEPTRVPAAGDAGASPGSIGSEPPPIARSVVRGAARPETSEEEPRSEGSEETPEGPVAEEPSRESSPEPVAETAAALGAPSEPRRDEGGSGEEIAGDPGIEEPRGGTSSVPEPVSAPQAEAAEVDVRVRLATSEPAVSRAEDDVSPRGPVLEVPGILEERRSSETAEAAQRSDFEESEAAQTSATDEAPEAGETLESGEGSASPGDSETDDSPTVWPTEDPACSDFVGDSGLLYATLDSSARTGHEEVRRLARRFGRNSFALVLGILRDTDGTTKQVAVLESSGVPAIDHSLRRVYAKSVWHPVESDAGPVACWVRHENRFSF